MMTKRSSIRDNDHNDSEAVLDNPIVEPLKQILLANPTKIWKLHELIQAVEDQATGDTLWPSQERSGTLVLFQKNFLVMNALYQLRALFWLQAKWLQVDYLEIRLFELSELHQPPLTNTDTGNTDTVNNSALSTPALHTSVQIAADLSDYYFDWENYLQATEATVTALMDRFWQRFTQLSQQSESAYDEALSTLELDASATTAEVHQRYRRLINQHHPDKGGQPSRFIEIRQAYERVLAHATHLT